MFVVAIAPKSQVRLGWREADDDKPTLAQRTTADLDLPGQWHVVAPARPSDLLARLEPVPGAEIYRR